MAIVTASATSVTRKKEVGRKISVPKIEIGGMPTRPPMPPVNHFHSVNSVTARICRPNEAATKYSPRTLRVGIASSSDSAAEVIIAAGRMTRIELL